MAGQVNWRLSGLRGPQGQVKITLDEDGIASNAWQFASSGNRINHNEWTAEPLPWYYDHEMPPFPGMEHLTQGMAGMRERTPKAGHMDTQQPGGSAGAGSSGNPDLPLSEKARLAPGFCDEPQV